LRFVFVFISTFRLYDRSVISAFLAASVAFVAAALPWLYCAAGFCIFIVVSATGVAPSHLYVEPDAGYNTSPFPIPFRSPFPLLTSQL